MANCFSAPEHRLLDAFNRAPVGFILPHKNPVLLLGFFALKVKIPQRSAAPVDLVELHPGHAGGFESVPVT